MKKIIVYRYNCWVAKVRKRGIPSQDSPLASCCLTTVVGLFTKPRPVAVVSHRCATTGSTRSEYFSITIFGLLNSKLTLIKLLWPVLAVVGLVCLAWLLNQAVRIVLLHNQNISIVYLNNETHKVTTFQRLREMTTITPSLNRVPRILEIISSLRLLEISQKAYPAITKETDTKSNKSLFSINSSDLQTLSEETELLANAVESHWEDLAEEEQNLLRKFLSELNSEIEEEKNLFSILKTKFQMIWIKTQFGNENLNKFLEAVWHLESALTEAVKQENSAEGRAIRRLASVNENTEWITLTKSDEDINIEEINEFLKASGFDTQIRGDSSSRAEDSGSS